MRVEGRLVNLALGELCPHLNLFPRRVKVVRNWNIPPHPTLSR
jgi:hypothetical protein